MRDMYRSQLTALILLTALVSVELVRWLPHDPMSRMMAEAASAGAMLMEDAHAKLSLDSILTLASDEQSPAHTPADSTMPSCDPLHCDFIVMCGVYLNVTHFFVPHFVSASLLFGALTFHSSVGKVPKPPPRL